MTITFHGPDPLAITLSVNGQEHRVSVEPRDTLLSVLRNQLGLTGAKEGCGQGTCGACTVIMDGETIYACLKLAIECQGHAIRTVESLAPSGELHPVQEAFIEHDGYQCGFCTSGQVLAAVALLEHIPDPSQDDIRREMAGNLCRCGAYPGIIQAVLSAAEEA